MSDYHSDWNIVSHSMLKVFRESPRKFHAIREGLVKPEDNRNLAFGRLFHTAVLEPEEVHNRYAIVEAYDRRTKAGKAAYEAAIDDAESQGKELVRTDEYEQVKEMVAGMRATPDARKILDQQAAERRVETVIEWHDKIDRKCKPDMLLIGKSKSLIVDLKTAADPTPEAFGRHALKYDYHCQMAWYIDGVKSTVFSGSDVSAVMIVVGKAAPHDCYVYRLTPQHIRVGQYRNEVAVNEIIEAEQSGEWLQYRQRRITELQIPHYALEIEA